MCVHPLQAALRLKAQQVALSTEFEAGVTETAITCFLCAVTASLSEHVCVFQVAFELHPWRDKLTFWNTSCAIYLLIFSAYWLYNVAHHVMDLRAAVHVRYFTKHKLGLSERQLQTVTWPDIASRIVQAS